jgi:hypothetical protein
VTDIPNYLAGDKWTEAEIKMFVERSKDPQMDLMRITRLVGFNRSGAAVSADTEPLYSHLWSQADKK